MINEWIKEEVYFLRVKMNLLQFVLFFLGWNFFLCFIYPMIIGSYFFIYPMLSVVTVLLLSFGFKSMFWLLLLLHWISEKISGVLYTILLFLSCLIVVLVFSWF